MRRKLLWAEMPETLQAKAVGKLRRLAVAKAKYDGTVFPYAWAERIAPLLRYSLCSRGTEIWDCNPPEKFIKRGVTLFSMPLLALGVIQQKEALV